MSLVQTMAKGVPLWKIRREIDCAIQKLKRPFSRVYDPFFQRFYDRDWQNKIQVISGDVVLGDKIAILLIFQPTKLRASTRETCDHLIGKGCAPLVVSNSPISSSDIEDLKSAFWNVMIRPNFGYDFGGYRDGLRFIESLGLVPSRILILNDSIWYPTLADETLISQMETTKADLVGSLYQEGDATLSKKSSRRNGFIESFFYLINGSCLQTPAFKRFWKNYRLSNLKYNAVYDGERQFSSQMQSAGLKVESIVSRSRFLSELSVQKPAFIRQVLNYSAYTNVEFSERCQALLLKYSESNQWKECALAHIEKFSAKHHFHSSFFLATMTLLGASFLKKGSGTVLAKGYGLLHHEMRTQYLRAIGDGVLPSPPPAIYKEISDLQAALAKSLPTHVVQLQ